MKYALLCQLKKENNNNNNNYNKKKLIVSTCLNLINNLNYKYMNILLYS